MRRGRRGALGLAAVLVSALCGWAPPAEAVSSASACTVRGTGRWMPGLTIVPTAQHIELFLDAACTGVGHDVGTYAFRIMGSGVADTCMTGTGAMSVQGSGPTGSATGTATYTRSGMQLTIDAQVTSGGHAHDVVLHLNVTPTPLPPQPVCLMGAQLDGTGVISS